MIDISPDDIIAERHASDGRFVLFTKTDLPAGCPLPWWGVTLDVGGDGFGLLVRLDDRYGPEGWTAADLLHVATARITAERKRRFPPADGDLYHHVRQALLSAEARSKSARPPPELRPGPIASPYPWTLAIQDGRTLPLCPDPAGQDEGVTLEQLLIILDQLFEDGCVALPANLGLRACRLHLQAALPLEVARIARLRGGS